MSTSKSFQQMIDKANADLLVLSKQHEETLARFQAIQAELQTLEAQANARAVKLSTMRQNVAQLRTNFETQKAHANLAEGTPEAPAATAYLKEQGLHLKQQEKALVDLVDASEQEQQRDHTQRMRLQAEHDQCNARLADIRTKGVAKEQAKVQAEKELGQSEYRDVVSQITLAQATIRAKAKELADAQQSLTSIVDEGMVRLTQWPEHQREAGQLVPTDDAMLIVCKHHLADLDILLAHARELPDQIDLPSTQFLSTWMELLTMTPYEMFGVEHIKNTPTTLREKRDRLARLIDEYNSWKGL